MKDIIGYIETSKKKYPICFNLNVLEEIQNRYGSLSAWGDIVESKVQSEPNIKDLKTGLTIMINEAIDMLNEDLQPEEREELLDEKKVGRIISEVGFTKMTTIIMDLTKKSAETDANLKNG